MGSDHKKRWVGARDIVHLPETEDRTQQLVRELAKHNAKALRITFSAHAHNIIKAHVSEPRRPTVPPQADRILTLLVPTDRLEEVLGDFEEGFQLVTDRHGEEWARTWYKIQVARYAVGRAISFLARLGDAVGKVLKQG